MRAVIKDLSEMAWYILTKHISDNSLRSSLFQTTREVHRPQNKIFFSLLLDGTSNVTELLYPDYIVPLNITINGPELTRIRKIKSLANF